MARELLNTEALTQQSALQDARSRELTTFGSFSEAFRQGVMDNPVGGVLLREGSYLTRRWHDSRKMSEQEYKDSKYFRPNIPYQQDMSVDQAAALASWGDAARARAQRLNQTSGWGAKLAGALVGSAMDPVNYIPGLGQAARAWSVTKFGVAGGRVAAASADAAINTAVAYAVAAPTRQSYGDDVSFENALFEVAMAAGIGSIFGTVQGVSARARARREAVALKEIAVEHQALNDAVGSHLETGNISVRPETTARMDAIAVRATRNDAARVASDTASAAVSRTQTAEISNLPDFDAFARAQEAELDPVAKEAKGKADARMAAAEDKLVAAEKKLDDAEATAVARKDPASGEIVRGISDELKTDIPKAREEELLRQKDSILRSLGVRSKDTTIGATKQIREAKKSISAARASVSKISKELDTASKRRMTVNAALRRPKTDRFTPPPDAPLEIRSAAEVRRPGKTEDFYDTESVNPETGEFFEHDAYKQALDQGRLRPGNVADFDKATRVMADTEKYNKALRQAALCEVS